MVTRQVQIKSTFHLYYFASVVYNSFNFYLFIFGCTGSSLLAWALIAARGLLIVMASLVADHRL